jgi:predicted HicB family RNase H-like nuclease
MMDYKGFIGIVEYDSFHGEVINTKDVITFQVRSVQEIEKTFTESIEDYLRNFIGML